MLSLLPLLHCLYINNFFTTKNIYTFVCNIFILTKILLFLQNFSEFIFYYYTIWHHTQYLYSIIFLNDYYYKLFYLWFYIWNGRKWWTRLSLLRRTKCKEMRIIYLYDILKVCWLEFINHLCLIKINQQV